MYRSRQNPDTYVVAQLIGGVAGIMVDGQRFLPGDYLCTNAYGVEFGMRCTIFHRFYVRV